MSTALHLHIERLVIDEAVHRAGPAAVRAAVAAQLPALLAARGISGSSGAALAHHAAGRVASRLVSPAPSASTTPRK